MRTEKEMYDLILGVAKRDERVRAVYMNGSRANPNVKRDLFQDYDIVYAVTETASFLHDPSWISVFGEVLVMQEPELMDHTLGKKTDFDTRYAYLMQFADGNRIDLTLLSLPQLQKEYGEDGLTVPLLDKDGILKPLGAPTDEAFWVKRPTQAQYAACCNEFFWVAPYCAKGLWRNELLYANEMLFHYVLEQLKKMLSWYAGTLTGFQVSMGKADKRLAEFLSPNDWERLTHVFCADSTEHAWEALFSAYGLFMEYAKKVGDVLGYAYNATEGGNSLLYAKRVRSLPSDATDIF